MEKRIGYIGLGKMGKNMVERLLRQGYDPVVFDVDAKAVRSMVGRGAKGAMSIEDFCASLPARGVIWLMVPHQHVGGVLESLLPVLRPGSTVIDGGNSPYKASMRRAELLEKRGIGFLDVGVSGGPSGALNGACLMVGGPRRLFRKYEGLFRDLSVPGGYGYVGPSGAGHFVKMVHNGIEYGMMQALAEGFDILRRARSLKLDLGMIADIYNHGSVIESRLVGWLAKAFKKSGEKLQGVSGSAAESGEGRWTVESARELDVPIAVISQAFDARIASNKKPGFQGRIIMALRHEFGGHDPRTTKKGE